MVRERVIDDDTFTFASLKDDFMREYPQRLFAMTDECITAWNRVVDFGYNLLKRYLEIGEFDLQLACDFMGFFYAYSRISDVSMHQMERHMDRERYMVVRELLKNYGEIIIADRAAKGLPAGFCRRCRRYECMGCSRL